MEHLVGILWASIWLTEQMMEAQCYKIAQGLLRGIEKI
jgi:hypothetical protein